MLKYFGFLFALFFLISIPTLMIFKSGTVAHEVALTRWIASYSLGNLGESKEIISSSTLITNTTTFEANVELSCLK